MRKVREGKRIFSKVSTVMQHHKFITELVMVNSWTMEITVRNDFKQKGFKQIIAASMSLDSGHALPVILGQ